MKCPGVEQEVVYVYGGLVIRVRLGIDHVLVDDVASLS